jgi:hypothetical protein
MTAQQIKQGILSHIDLTTIFIGLTGIIGLILCITNLGMLPFWWWVLFTPAIVALIGLGIWHFLKSAVQAAIR